MYVVDTQYFNTLELLNAVGKIRASAYSPFRIFPLFMGKAVFAQM